MNLGDLSFEITQGVEDGELNISPSGILTGVINTVYDENYENNKSKVKVTAKDGQTKDIEITWIAKIPSLKVSGFKEELSEFNDTYTIKNISESIINAEAGDYKYGIGKYITIDYYPKNTDYEWWNCMLDISTANAEGIRYQDTTLRATSNGDLTTVNSLKFKQSPDDAEPILIEISR
jgi:hypothetical protein